MLSGTIWRFWWNRGYTREAAHWYERALALGAGTTVTALAKVRLAASRSSQRVVFFLTKINKGDMMVLRELLEAGKLTPVIDRRYELSEIADALRYMGEGHAQGKIVITV